MFIWGDFLDQQALWQRLVPKITKYAEGLRAQGTDIAWVDLPKRGIAGNSHMLMMDTNSDEIAGIAVKWLADKGLLQR